jgi:DNA topoisomerase-3
VWIDSQTEEEILRGIKEAKLLSEYDNLSDAAYLRAKEDYLMGINFSRALTLKYGYTVRTYLGVQKCVIAVGRVMTCVLGMIVSREREIRSFVPVPFYRVVASLDGFEAEWKAVAGTAYENSPLLYKENGFKERASAQKLIEQLSENPPVELDVAKVEKKIEKKAPPLLYNLAELQNDCSKIFKINPSQTLDIVQQLYEKKLVTYPRTDARVLSTAVSKEIGKNISGLKNYEPVAKFAEYIMAQGGYKGIAKSKYVNDKQITDHYAIIPTGQGLGNLRSVSETARGVYDVIARRFISIFFPPAEYEKVGLTLTRTITEGGKKPEQFSANFKRLVKQGYLQVAKNPDKAAGKNDDAKLTPEMMEKLNNLKKGDKLSVNSMDIKEGETSPPKRYSSGTLILAMENAGNLIEDEELREQIKGSGIGTSATRDSIISKLVNNGYIQLNNKTQIVTPTFLGEIIYDVVKYSINNLLRAEMTASWEKGLAGVADGTISEAEYTEKMNSYVIKNTELVKKLYNSNGLIAVFNQTKPYYEKQTSKKKS